jgi:alpha-amylase
LQQAIRQLIDIRRQYIGGTLTVLTETGHPNPANITRNVYVARRQGNGIKNGAIIMLNNHDSDTLSIKIPVNCDGFEDWSGRTLVNLLNIKEVVMVSSDGRATLSASNRGYSIWVLQNEL